MTLLKNEVIQHGGCGGLNEISPYGLIYFSIWSLFDETEKSCGLLRGVVLLGVCVGFQKPVPFHVSVLYAS